MNVIRRATRRGWFGGAAAIAMAFASLIVPTMTAGDAAAATTSSAGAPKTDWAKVRYAVVIQKVTNATKVRGDALASVLEATTRSQFASVPGVLIVVAGSLPAREAAARGVPTVGLSADIVGLDQQTTGSDLKVHARVSFAFTQASSVKASLEGSASTLGDTVSLKSATSLARLQDMAIEGAVASAVNKAPGALKAASGK